MKKYKVEYLLGLSNSIPYCRSQKAYTKMISTLEDTKISNSGSYIEYKDLKINFIIKTINKPDEKMKYYNVSFSIKDSNNIKLFTKFLSNHKKLISKILSTEIEEIWNDISLYYSNISYPLIYEIENLMRMLITKFMLLKVGLNWTNENVPESVKSSIKKKQ